MIYVSCDGMAARDLRRLLTLGRALTRSVDAPTRRRRVWLLDEISGITGWSSVLKAARDTGDFGDVTVVTVVTVVATGSRWVSTEDVQGNLFAGRAGSGSGHRIRQLLPMGFRDYLVATRPQLPLPPVTHPGELDGASAVFPVRSLNTSAPARSALPTCETCSPGCVRTSTRTRLPTPFRCCSAASPNV